MSKTQEVLVTAGALILTHAMVCVYLAFTTKDRGSYKRGLTLIVGNCLLCLIFYVPARVAPKEYFLAFAMGFIAGFAALIQYVNWIRKQEVAAGQTQSFSESK